MARVADALGWPLFEWQRLVADVSLEHDAGQYQYRTCVASVGRQNGKSTLMAARICFELLRPGHQVAFTAQDRGMARHIFEWIVEAVMASSLGRRVAGVAMANGREVLTMTNGSTLKIITPSRKGARGLTLDLVVIDEAAQINMETLGAVQPTLATRPNGQLFLVSNAGDADSVLLRHYRALGHEAGDSTDTRLAWLEWAPTADRFDPADPVVWAQAIPTLAEAGGVTLAAVAEAAATVDSDVFAREWLNSWVAAEATSVITAAEWEALERPDMVIGQGVVLGLDVAPDRTSATIGAAGRSGAWTPVEIVDARPYVGWVLDRLVDLWGKWRAPVVIDGGSPAGSLIIELEQAGVEVIAIGARDYSKACGSFYDACADGLVTHLGDRMLANAVRAATRRKLGDSWAWNRRSTVDITPLVAVTLARWGLIAGSTPRPKPAIF